jgi:hypothetical protein
MPDANGNFKGVYVPAEAWERIFGSPSEAQGPQNTLRASYEEHLDVLGPVDHSPFIRDFRR